MAALFLRLSELPNVSNPRSKSAVNVVRTRSLKKSSANQRFLRPVSIDLITSRERSRSPRSSPLPGAERIRKLDSAEQPQLRHGSAYGSAYLCLLSLFFAYISYVLQ